MTSSPIQFRLRQATIGFQPLRGGTVQYVHGLVEPVHFDDVSIPSYQRAAMTGVKLTELMEAMTLGGYGIPDDLLLCTTDNSTMKPLGAGELVLSSPRLDVMDGHQRLHAGRSLLNDGIPCVPLVVKILLDLNLQLQKSIFYQINRKHTEVQSHVHLRNWSETSATLALRELADANPDIIPSVQWEQARGSADITAHMLLETAIVLHGSRRKGSIEEILDTLERVDDALGTTLMCTNVLEFYRILALAFPPGIPAAVFRHRVDLIMGVARLLSSYLNFWRGDRLKVVKDDYSQIGKVNAVRLQAAIDKKSSSAEAVKELLEGRFKNRTINALQERDWEWRDQPEGEA